MSEYIVKQAYETDSKGYNNKYWLIQAADGRAVVGLEHEQDSSLATQTLNSETEALRRRIAELEAENEQLRNQIKHLESQVYGGSTK